MEFQKEQSAYADEIAGISRLRDLVRAQEDGQLVVSLCKVGDTVYVTGEGRIVECCIDEIYFGDTKGTEYLV